MTTGGSGLYTTEFMDGLRLRGDELADATVETLFARGEMGTFNTLMRWFGESGRPLPDGLPAVAREYLEATSTPPDWVDWDVMENARLFFIDNNVHISTALAFAAMPACYLIPSAARLMSITHGLEYPSRRMAETGQFTVYLMQPDAFQAGGRFIPAAQKVRLLHASIRHHLRRGDHWDVAAQGVPLCQEDMVGAQMLFSLTVLDALHRLGIHMSEEGAESYYYAWRVVGAMLGCDTSVVPADMVAARGYSDLYLTRHMGPSAEGTELARKLIELYEGVVPGRLFDPLVPALIRFLIGDTAADWLEVPSSNWDHVARVVPTVLGLFERLEDSGPWAEWVLDHLGGVTSALELSSLTRGRIMHYSIPEELKDDYGVAGSRGGRWSPPPLTVGLPG
jgi:ER-bound oxygenase mpaB/B'/Rubber oxygenase, catalytic domain